MDGLVPLSNTRTQTSDIEASSIKSTSPDSKHSLSGRLICIVRACEQTLKKFKALFAKPKPAGDGRVGTSSNESVPESYELSVRTNHANASRIVHSTLNEPSAANLNKLKQELKDNIRDLVVGLNLGMDSKILGARAEEIHKVLCPPTLDAKEIDTKLQNSGRDPKSLDAWVEEINKALSPHPLDALEIVTKLQNSGKIPNSLETLVKKVNKALSHHLLDAMEIVTIVQSDPNKPLPDIKKLKQQTDPEKKLTDTEQTKLFELLLRISITKSNIKRLDSASSLLKEEPPAQSDFKGGQSGLSSSKRSFTVRTIRVHAFIRACLRRFGFVYSRPNPSTASVDAIGDKKFNTALK